jgi:ribosomal protein S18 acetylase RimI-like enzyme
MNHVLDNPIFNALISGNASLARGRGETRYFPEEMSTFTGFSTFSAGEFRTLAEDFVEGSVRATFAPGKVDVPMPWIQIGGMEIYQMVHDRREVLSRRPGLVVPLNDDHIPAMLALTKITNPGPFNSRTIDFGNYFGCFDKEQLIAMAGYRLQLHDYTEISAVCTHPGYTGKGYARELLTYHVQQILLSGKTPMLHVKKDNSSAIALYESLGFRIRRSIEVIIFQKAGA